MGEIWKPVDAVEDRYEISSLGAVRTVPRMETGPRKRFRPSMPIRPARRGKYLSVCLFCDGRYRQESIHVLVAAAFLQRPERPVVIDHINGDPHDNRASNLRYVSVSLNARNSDKTWSKSGFRGVGFNKNPDARKPWFARAILHGKQIWLGSFITAEEAAEAYERFRLESRNKDAENASI